MQKQVLHNQSLMDFSLQHTGSFKNAFLNAFENGKSITDSLEAGEILSIPANVITDDVILNYYNLKDVKPATAITQSQIDELEANGIGYMIIEETFIVS